MKTLREQYNKLENDIYAEFQRLINIGDYDILSGIVKEYYDSTADEIFSDIDERGIEEVSQEYDILDYCETIYYNNRRGDEVAVRLLGVEKESGLYIFDEDYWKTGFISFSDLNGLDSKIEVIESIKNA